jgi:elongation factor Ts
MAEMSATVVKQLRDRTGQAMMDCKKALIEAGGDMEKAVDILRKKGMAVLEKRGGRETKEGKLVGKISGDGKTAVLTMLCCETDFTAKNEQFQAAAQALADGLLASGAGEVKPEGLAQLAAGGGKKIGDVVNDIISKTGEKVLIGDCVRFTLAGPGLIHCYVHFNGKIGTMLQIEASSEAVASHKAVKELANDLAMHVTAVNPMAVSRAEIDPAAVERERAIGREQVVGKPENMVEKIVEGKLNKWYQQVALLEQPFVKDDSKTVQQLLAEVGKQAGGSLTLKRFARLQID